MDKQESSFGKTLWSRMRLVAAMMIAGLWPGRDAPDIDARIRAQTPFQQLKTVGGVLGFLFLLSLWSAQFGLLGMGLFFLTVIVVAN